MIELVQAAIDFEKFSVTFVIVIKKTRAIIRLPSAPTTNISTFWYLLYTCLMCLMFTTNGKKVLKRSIPDLKVLKFHKHNSVWNVVTSMGLVWNYTYEKWNSGFFYTLLHIYSLHNVSIIRYRSICTEFNQFKIKLVKHVLMLFHIAKRWNSDNKI